SWDGVVELLPAPGEAVAVLAGRYILLFDRARDRVRLVDADDGRTAATSLLPPRYDAFPIYTASARAAAFHSWSRDVLVGDAEGVLEWFRIDFDVHSAVWTSDSELLLVGADGHCALDVLTGEQDAVEGYPAGTYPRVGVTGRFDLDDLRSR